VGARLTVGAAGSLCPAGCAVPPGGPFLQLTAIHDPEGRLQRLHRSCHDKAASSASRAARSSTQLHGAQRVSKGLADVWCLVLETTSYQAVASSTQVLFEAAYNNFRC
jgi:hypothetical protein